MKVVSIIGARPQFIKAAPVSRVLQQRHTEVVVHTGQHYDYDMSEVFFRELTMPDPAFNLGVGSGPHGWQTGRILAQVEEVLVAQRPDCVLVYGDTNTTLAGALAAAKLDVPLAHVEAGLRSFNRHMPEEHNRVLTDHCSNLLFCPTDTAVANLANEGITGGVHLVGDVMYDAVLQNGVLATRRSVVLKELGLRPKRFLLVTVHRPCNTDAPERLRSILETLVELDEPVVFPVHPRARRQMSNGQFADLQKARVLAVAPVGYLDMLVLAQNARMILTDSGGMQKEAYFHAVPCVTLRSETEWVELVQAGWNVVVDVDPARILWAVNERMWPQGPTPPIFGDGHAAEKVVDVLSKRDW